MTRYLIFKSKSTNLNTQWAIYDVEAKKQYDANRIYINVMSQGIRVDYPEIPQYVIQVYGHLSWNGEVARIDSKEIKG